MKKYCVAALAACAVIASFSAAQAEERWPRWYIGVGGGYTYMSDQDVSGGGATSLSLNDGYGVSGSIGYLPSSTMPLLNQLRFEAEVTYHESDLHSFDLVGGGSVGANGTYSSTAYLANVYYDFPTASAWSPYVGAGLGMATLHISGNPALGTSSNSDNEFAYQLLAGIGYSPVSIPNTQWTLGYRYLATSDAKFSGVDVEYSTHSVEAGAKLRF